MKNNLMFDAIKKYVVLFCRLVQMAEKWNNFTINELINALMNELMQHQPTNQLFNNKILQSA